MSNEQFIIAFLESLKDDISRINDTIDKNQDRLASFVNESTADRKDIRVLVVELQRRTEGLSNLCDRLSELYGEHKKKGIAIGILGFLTGGSFYLGKLDMQKILDKIIAFIKG
jgi:hypothetical protein